MKKKYHYLYRTTHTKTNRYYIGVHSTSNLEDGYLGSGTNIRNLIRSHGPEAFDFQILEYFDSSKKVLTREAEVVNENLLQDPLCLNIRLGGKGGWDYVNQNLSKEYLVERARKAGSHPCSWKGETLSEETKRKIGQANRGKQTWWKGRSHSEETKQRMSKSLEGKAARTKNSQFGTIWITNGSENQKIKKTDSIPEGWDRGRYIKHTIGISSSGKASV